MSLPTTSGKGAYAGQNAAVNPDRVRQVLAEVRERHTASQPIREIVVEREVDKPIVPVSVEAEIRKHTAQWSWITAIGARVLGGLIIALLLRRQIVCAVQDVRKMIEG